MMQAQWRRAAIGALLCLTAACGALDVSDPTQIEDGELANAAGAELLRKDALKEFYTAVGQASLQMGLLTDELFADNPPDYVSAGYEWEEIVFDRRDSETLENGTLTQYSATAYSSWQSARRAATVAMPKLRAYGPPAHVGEMYALRAFAELSLAEQVCPGFPLHDLNGLTPVYGGPLTMEQALERAAADFDSAIALAIDSVRVLDFARIGKARALAGLGRYGEIGALTAPVSDGYTSEAEYSMDAGRNPFEPMYFGYYLVRGVSDHEGGVGLDFVSANDPRVELDSVGVAADGTTIMYGVTKYPTEDSPIVVASGIEARLLEAEAALNGGGNWIGILNALRATYAPTLSVLVDPGTEAARVDMLFRERAFWLYGTGHRVGDLRRLVARYNRAVESVYPTGPYRLGGTYGDGTGIPFSTAREAQFNPAITGCLAR